MQSREQVAPVVTVRLGSGVLDDPVLRQDARAAARAVQQALPYPVPVHLAVNANRSTMIRATRQGRTLRLSVHWALVPCADEIVAFVVHSDRSVLPALQATFQRHQPPRSQRTPHRRTAGEHHDLEALLAQVQADAFAVPVAATITWGRRGRRPRRARQRSLRFGSRDETGLVRVHPVLDHASVPAWFVRYVIFHELLHAVHRPETSPSGRRRVHPPAFRAAERAHADHDRATVWQAAHLDRLIRLC